MNLMPTLSSKVLKFLRFVPIRAIWSLVYAPLCEVDTLSMKSHGLTVPAVTLAIVWPGSMANAQCGVATTRISEIMAEINNLVEELIDELFEELFDELFDDKCLFFMVNLLVEAWGMDGTCAWRGARRGTTRYDALA